MFHGMLKSKPINNAHLDACHTVDLSKYRCNLLQYTLGYIFCQSAFFSKANCLSVRLKKKIASMSAKRWKGAVQSSFDHKCQHFAAMSGASLT